MRGQLCIFALNLLAASPLLLGFLSLSFGGNVHAAIAAAETRGQQPTTAVYETQWYLSSNDSANRLCVANEDNEYKCATLLDQMEAGQKLDIGVAQRIDGSDKERIAIQNVLDQMKEYFLNEVLAKPAYKDVRNKWYVVKNCQWQYGWKTAVQKKFLIRHHRCLVHHQQKFL